MDLATPFKTFRWQIHLPIHPSLAGCYVAEASTCERGNIINIIYYLVIML